MKIREHLLENNYDMGTSGTLSFDLDYTDPITEIILRIAATNGAQGNLDNPIERNISKIEIVDGGEVLYDSPGDVVLAAVTHFNNKIPNCYRTAANADGGYQAIPLQFGRYLYDSEYAFNPNGHRNPQLKITFDEATVRAASATGFSSDTFNLSITVRLMENAPAPSAFLSLREIETFTTADSGDKVINMPVDRVIRALLCRVYESGVDIRTDISKYKLTADGGKFVAFDLHARNMIDIMGEHFSPVMIPLYSTTAGTTTLQTWVAVDYEAFLRAHTATYIATGASSWPSQMRVNVSTHAGAATSGQAVHLGVMGLCFHNLIIYPFGDLSKPEHWFNARDYKKLDLVLSQGGADAECNVCVQQVYSY